MEKSDITSTAELFRPLHAELISLLRSLSPEDWKRSTIAGEWKVRDVVAHLLDGDLRRLSFHRDRHPVPKPEMPIDSYDQIVAFINRLNRGWVQVAQRLSPPVLLGLLEQSGREVVEFVEGLDPFAEGLFAVAWAGEEASLNWMDIGREYTERWHHQQQIRDAVGAPLLLDATWVRPLLELSVRALPRSFQSVTAQPGTEIQIEITGSGGGEWTLKAEKHGWVVREGISLNPGTTIRLPIGKAWRMFFNALAPEDDAGVELVGERRFAHAFRTTRAVMV